MRGKQGFHMEGTPGEYRTNSIGRPLPEGTMRSIGVVVLSPSLDTVSGIGQRQEPDMVQTLFAQLAVKRFDDGVIRGFPTG